MIKDIALVDQANKEGDTFFLITQIFPSSFPHFCNWVR